MADAVRDPAHAVIALRPLAERALGFGFFAAMRRIECAAAARPRLGTALRAADDPVRIGQEVSLAFAPSTLAGFTAAADGAPHHLAVRFFGLFGPNGPLPLHLTELAHTRRLHHGDRTLSRFADVFHHRLLALLYRAWAAAEPTVAMDRPDTDPFATFVGALCGLGMPSLRARDAIPHHAKLYYAGRLGAQTRHAEGLRAVIGDYFGVPVRLQEFVAEWLDVPPQQLSLLGRSARLGSRGATATLGARVREAQHRFRVVLGPLTRVDYERFLPGNASLAQFAALVRGYVGDELAWDVRLVLRRDEAPPCVLGRRSRLGWTSWLWRAAAADDAVGPTLDPIASLVAREPLNPHHHSGTRA